MTGTQLLARVREFHRTAKRLLLIDGGYGPPPEPILQAIALGHIDAYAARPATVPDEEFHLAVTELLEEWARSNLPRPEVMRVVGEEWSARSHEIRDLLSRNVVPFGFYPAGGGPGKALLEQAGAAAAALPVIIMFDGRVLENPSNTQIAEALGVQTSPGGGLYDVAVIGAGPAGLAAAVYGASEGLSTVVLEPEAIGGQAGTSSHIRNYLGFPTGVSGEDLAVRAYTQAWNFGAEYVYGNPATGLRVQGPERVVTVAGGDEVRSRAVVIATGVSYRRLGIPSLDALTGAGVFYGAATSEAKAMKDREVFVVGGANSAGQAAVHLARYAAQVTMLVRGQSLAEGMSEYLVKEITSTPNIAVRHSVVGDGRRRDGLPGEPDPPGPAVRGDRDRSGRGSIRADRSRAAHPVAAGQTSCVTGGVSWSPGPTCWRAATRRRTGRSSARPCFWSPACPGSSRSATSAADR